MTTCGSWIPGLEIEGSPRARRKMRHHWRLGARLGPDASGLYSQKVSDLNATPPGSRKAGFREVMEALRCPGQVGCPPSVATDAQKGFPVMAHQSAEVLFDRRYGDGRILVRHTGTCARAHRGRQAEMTQRAKVGHCSCCTRLTHVAVLPRYKAGEYSGHKAHEIQLRKEHRP